MNPNLQEGIFFYKLTILLPLSGLGFDLVDSDSGGSSSPSTILMAGSPFFSCSRRTF